MIHNLHSCRSHDLSSSGGGTEADGLSEFSVSQGGANVVVAFVLLGTKPIEGIHLDDLVRGYTDLLYQNLFVSCQWSLSFLGGGHRLVSSYG